MSDWVKNKNYPSVTAQSETDGEVVVFFLTLFEKLFYGTEFHEVVVE